MDMRTQVETVIEVATENRDRKTVFWRPFLIVPPVIFICSFTQMAHWGWSTGVLVVPTVLALVFRQKYPSYILNFNHSFMELQTRIASYILLLTDEVPSIEANPKFAILLPDVEGGARLKRYAPLYKWLLSIPLVFVGIIYILVTHIAVLISWFSIVINGKYPQWAREITLGTLKFWNRLYGYAILLVTDEYPSFSL